MARGISEECQSGPPKMSGQKHVKEIFSGALQKKKQVLEQKPAKP
jgi:hypothetical protein